MQTLTKFAIIGVIIAAMVTLMWKSGQFNVPDWLKNVLPNAPGDDEGKKKKGRFTLKLRIRGGSPWLNIVSDINKIPNAEYDINAVNDALIRIDGHTEMGTHVHNIDQNNKVVYTIPGEVVVGYMTFVQQGTLFGELEVIKVPHPGGATHHDCVIQIWKLVNRPKSAIAVVNVFGKGISNADNELALANTFTKLEEYRKLNDDFYVILFLRMDGNNELMSNLVQALNTKAVYGKKLGMPGIETLNSDLVSTERIITDMETSDFLVKSSGEIEEVVCSVSFSL